MTDKTDREMLELAARAAGYSFKWGKDWHDKGVPLVDDKSWNPLDDDGDALRLAVKLGLDIEIEWYDDDPLAATRRAIVKAAAEIGRGIAQSVGDDLPEDDYYKTLTGAEEIGRAADIGKGMK